MISATYAKSQIDRMAGMRGFPQVPAAAAELVKKLQQCTSEKHALGVVDAILSEDRDYCPQVYELEQVILRVRNTISRPLVGCDECYEGWVLVEGIIGWNSNTYSGLRPCKCRKS